MTKAQALAFVNALESHTIPCDVSLRFQPDGSEQWSVQLDVTHTYTGADLAALTNYCAQQGLQITAIFDKLGVV